MFDLFTALTLTPCCCTLDITVSADFRGKVVSPKGFLSKLTTKQAVSRYVDVPPYYPEETCTSSRIVPSPQCRRAPSPRQRWRRRRSLSHRRPLTDNKKSMPPVGNKKSPPPTGNKKSFPLTYNKKFIPPTRNKTPISYMTISSPDLEAKFETVVDCVISQLENQESHWGKIRMESAPTPERVEREQTNVLSEDIEFRIWMKKNNEKRRKETPKERICSGQNYCFQRLWRNFCAPNYVGVPESASASIVCVPRYSAIHAPDFQGNVCFPASCSQFIF